MEYVADKWLNLIMRAKRSSYQFAYVPGPGKGATSILVFVYNRILKSLDKFSGAVRILPIDLSKAFDRLAHSSIMNACLQFSVRLQAFLWIRSFLKDRFQRVNYT